MSNLICSDASFCPQTRIAVIGFLDCDANNIEWQVITDTTNIKAEIQAFEMARSYTQRKNDGNEKHERTEYIFGVDCRKVVTLGTQQNLQMIWIKGHKPSCDKDPIDRQFSQLDKYLRKQLRAYRSSLHEGLGSAGA